MGGEDELSKITFLQAGAALEHRWIPVEVAAVGNLMFVWVPGDAGGRTGLTSLVFPPFSVPGEVPCDPALQVREPAAHPSGHIRLGEAELPEPPWPGSCALWDPAPLPPTFCSFCLMRGCLLRWVLNRA